MRKEGPMRAFSFLALAVMLSAAAEANAQYVRRCAWIEGIYVCNSQIETPYSRTTTLCASGLTTACKTTTYNKIPARPASQRDVTVNLDDEARKATARAASGYRDPPGSSQR